MHSSFSELMEAQIQGLVQFGKNLSHFNSLSQSDQLALVKGAFPEMWIAQSARYVSLSEERMTMCDGARVHKSELNFIFAVSYFLHFYCYVLLFIYSFTHPT